MTPHSLLVASLAALTLAACASQSPAPSQRAAAELLARSGSQVSGSVQFSQYADKLVIEARLSGLTPGEHGFHIHDKGDCSAADASSAGGHFNPAGKAHGHHGQHDRHAGDLPNLVADAQGNAVLRVESTSLKLQGEQGIAGRSVVVHADPDDYRSQPAGNSGKRVACGRIG